MPAEGFQPNSSVTSLALSTLGGWGLSTSLGATPTPLFGPSKPLALLVYLALSPGRTSAREHLLDLLWADLEPTASTHAYRQTVWYIRQRLGEASLRAGGNQLTLITRVETDRDAFLAAVEHQDWERAVALYTGDFLPGFAAPGGAEFERWADLERWRLRGLFVRAGDALARQHLASGHAREAVALARRVRDTDRSAEPGWRLLLEALVAAGDPVGAAVEADQLEEMLREDGRDPEPATRSLLRLAHQESQESAEADTARGLVAELVGRELEFGAIVAAWDAVRRGAARHIHITGAAGLGKSRLVADAQTRLKASGARTVLVRAAPGERALSYALAADLAVALAAQTGSAAVSSATAGTLVGLGPGLAARYPAAEPDRSVGDELLRRRVLAVAELVAAIADEAPLALLLDDVHWMDTHSRQLVAGLIGRLARSQVLVVTTARPGPEGALDNPETKQLFLEPLSAPQVGALVASFGVLPDAGWAKSLPDNLRAAAKGSPLIVLETLELAIERGILELGAAGWHCPATDDLARLLAGGAALRQRLERLTREQRWLLLLLAVHGTPVPFDLLRVIASRPDDALQADLLVLEQRALASRERGEWQPAHDAIAEMAIELASQEAVQAAHAALGRAMAPDSGEPGALPRAAQHFAAADDTEALNRVFRRWVRAARSRGDRRGLKPLAQELLGHDANGGADALVRALPLHLRIGLVTPGRIALTAAVLVVAAIGVASRITARDDVVVRVIGLVPDSDGVRPVQISVTEEDLLSQRTLDLSRAVTVPDLPGHLSPRPIGLDYLGNDTWTWTTETGRPNGEEPLVFTRKTEVRLPPAPGDDAVGSESPDGRFVAIYTDRWATSNAGDVGIFEIATGSLRQVTSGPDRDVVGPWSPDGTRIAFERLPYDLRSPALCWVTFDGGRVSCFAPEGWNLQGIISGWISPHEILASGIDSTGQSSVYSVNLDTRASTRLFSASYAYGLAGSPWILCLCDVKAGGGSELQLRRIDVPGRAVHLTGLASLERRPTLALVPGQASPGRYLDRLVVAGPPDSAVAPGVPYHFEAAGVSPDHTGVEVPVLEWAVKDSSVAAINAQGILIGKRAGRTTVYASAGGWRRDSVSVRVVARREIAALSEAWSSSWVTRWRPYGEPQPRVVEGPAGPALFVAGDSDYYSGVYSRATFAADSGLGVRATVRTAVPLVKWQMLHIAFWPLRDTAALQHWDHRTAKLPLDANDESLECGANYPTGEAVWGKHFVSLSTGGEYANVPVDSSLATGKPWVLTLQLLPDGRCGVAINGRAMRVSSLQLTTRQPRHVVIDGQSVRTRILVDHLEVWRGVRQDIDWSSVDSSAVHR